MCYWTLFLILNLIIVILSGCATAAQIIEKQTCMRGNAYALSTPSFSKQLENDGAVSVYMWIIQFPSIEMFRSSIAYPFLLWMLIFTQKGNSR